MLDLDTRRRAVTTRMQEAQSRRNDASKAIGAAMGRGDKDEAERLKAEVAELKDTLPALEDEDRELSAQLQDELARIPNLPADDVPEGADEAKTSRSPAGAPRASLISPRWNMPILARRWGWTLKPARCMSGARFTFLRGAMARLKRALGQFMLDMQTGANGYTECAPPLLVRDEAMFGTGQLPKFAEDLFRTTDGRWLIPTAEVSLTNAVREQILADAALPIRMTALTPCFRSEAGAAGRDTRGFIRQHQFDKVELVTICTPEDSRTPSTSG